MSAVEPRLVAAPLDSIDLAAAYPWPDSTPWIRAMMLLSLDGAVAGADGRSGSLSSATDRAVLAEVRRLSDVVLIGAGTLRAERYRPMKARAEDAAERSRLGLASAPVLAIVSRSLDLPWDEPVFRESARRPLVLTAQSAPAAALAVAGQHAEVITVPGDDVDPPALVAGLLDRGLTRIVCEGGPRLLASLSAQDLVDEADITFAPVLASGGQVATGSAVIEAARFDLAHAIVDDGFLFTRYVARRARIPPGPA